MSEKYSTGDLAKEAELLFVLFSTMTKEEFYPHQNYLKEVGGFIVLLI